MALTRRCILGVAVAAAAVPGRATGVDSRRTERAIGSAAARHTVIECFSLTCPHCAEFAQDTLPELKARWIKPGQLRWVFYDLPTDALALQAAVVARYLPPERYERFIDTLLGNQDRWAYAGDDGQNELWLLAADAGMDRPTFDRAIADTDLRAWILGRVMDAENDWRVDATPSFLVDGKLHVGAFSAPEFEAILAH